MNIDTTKKIYARQIDPEYQESPFYLTDGEDYYDVIFDGNRDYKSRTTDEYEKIKNGINNMLGEIESITENDGYSYYRTITKYFNTEFKPTHKDRYNSREVHKWKAIANEYQICKSSDEWKPICKALTLMTGYPYETTTIRGCSQSDWQDIYYPSDIYNAKSIGYLEVDYFNTGSEWEIHEGDDEIEDADDVRGYTMYCYTYRPIEEIAAEMNVLPENVIAWEHDGYTRTAKYKLMEA